MCLALETPPPVVTRDLSPWLLDPRAACPQGTSAQLLPRATTVVRRSAFTRVATVQPIIPISVPLGPGPPETWSRLTQLQRTQPALRTAAIPQRDAVTAITIDHPPTPSACPAWLRLPEDLSQLRITRAPTGTATEILSSPFITVWRDSTSTKACPPAAARLVVRRPTLLVAKTLLRHRLRLPAVPAPVPGLSMLTAQAHAQAQAIVLRGTQAHRAPRSNLRASTAGIPSTDVRVLGDNERSSRRASVTLLI